MEKRIEKQNKRIVGISVAVLFLASQMIPAGTVGWAGEVTAVNQASPLPVQATVSVNVPQRNVNTPQTPSGSLEAPSPLSPVNKKRVEQKENGCLGGPIGCDKEVRERLRKEAEKVARQKRDERCLGGMIGCDREVRERLRKELEKPAGAKKRKI